MADVNKPEIPSEAVQTTPPAAASGIMPPPRMGTTPDHGTGPGHWKIWALQTLLSAGMAGLAVLLTFYLGYKLISALAVGLIVFFFSGFATRGLLKSSSDTKAQAAADEAPHHADGFREIIETIVFVVVLVLLLKSFAAEAFVIPTGSMAETLYGYQRIVKCPQCGVDFPVNCSSEVDPPEGQPPQPLTGCICPNCRYDIDFNHEKTPGWTRPDWNSGDRVLVAKFLYELANKQPNRFDVVVFKFPGNSNRGGAGSERQFPGTGPIRNHTPMNYIKRLIGLSGETIAIHRGKLYNLPADSGIEYDDWKKAQTDEELRLKLWEWEFMHVNDEKALKLFGEEKFNMLRKPPETMLAERRLVYDNDHRAKDLQDKGLAPRWSGAGWQAQDGKDNSESFKSGAGEAVQWLRYHHYLRTYNELRGDKPPVASLITDFMGYNFGTPIRAPSENWVGDLMLETDVTVDKSSGEVMLELSKSHDRFRMHWNLATGDIDLYRVHDGKEEKLATKKATQPKAGSTYKVRFADFDDRLTVWIDGNLPFDDGVIYNGSKAHNGGPTVENDLEPASIGIKGAGATASKLKLYRDTYYTAGDSPSMGDAGTIDFSNPDNWGALRKGMPVRTLYVQPHHYLCLGDNSPESSDGRSWGTVPERLLLGRAMLVYYPFNRAGRIR